VEVAGSHVAMISKPAETIDLIVSAIGRSLSDPKATAEILIALEAALPGIAP
jgi:hypothetical protein